MSLFLIPTFFLSEGFVAGVGPTGASYSAELSLDQSKVRISKLCAFVQTLMEMSQLEEGSSLFHMVAKENEQIQVSKSLNLINYPKRRLV